MISQIRRFMVGLTLLTLIIAQQSTLSEEKWRNFKPGQFILGCTCGLFIYWIMKWSRPARSTDKWEQERVASEEEK